MKQWPTKLLSEQVLGQFFSIALISVGLIFLTASDLTILNKAFVFALVTYLLLIFFDKQMAKPLLVVPLILVSLVLWKNFQTNRLEAPKVGDVLTVKIDQIKIRDNFAYGEAKLGKQTILFQLTADEMLKQKVRLGHDFKIRLEKISAKPIAIATNHAQFDLRRYYQKKGIIHQISIEKFESQSYPAQISFSEIRFMIGKFLNDLPPNLRFFASQLILGQLSDQNLGEIKESYKNLGIIHLLCLSGLHVVIYLTIIGFICDFLKISTSKRQIISTIILLFLCILANFQAGLVRASLSYVVSIILNKKKVTMNALDQLGLVFLIHELLVPGLILNLGAQLSYLLVLGLKIIPSSKQIIQSIWLNLLISPLLIANFYQINFLTCLYNLVAVPLFNFVVIPATFLGVISKLLVPGLTNFFEKILGVFNLGVLQTSSLGLENLILGKISLMMVLVMIFLTVGAIINHRPKLIKLLAGCYLIAFCVNKFPFWGQVTHIDVGQGDSILITTPIFRKVFLIDTGGRLNFGNHQPTRANVDKITIPYLKSQGIAKIDAVFLSHQDADHIGDLVALTKSIKVDEIYFGKGMEQNPSFHRKLRQIQGSKFRPILAPTTLSIGGQNFQILSPTKKGLGSNEDSMSIFLKFNQRKWLFTGDLDQEGEKKLIQNYPDLKIDYLKLGHHGSKTSSNHDFIEQLQPHLALISSGKNNRYGHPHQETMSLLESLKIPSMNTAKYGMINWYFGPFGYERFSGYLNHHDND